MNFKTNFERLAVLTAAIASCVAMCAALVGAQVARHQVQNQCVGYVPMVRNGQAVLLPFDACDPANKAALAPRQTKYQYRHGA